MSNLSSVHATLSPHGERAAGAALCVLSMSAIQFGAALSAPVMTELGVLPTSWLRLSWAAIALLIWTRPPLHRFGREQWVAAGLLGAASAAMTLLFFAAVQRIPLGLAAAIEFLGPLGVAAAGARSVRALAWPVLALVGVALLTGTGDAGSATDLPGLGMAAAAGVCWAVYIVMTKKVGRAFDGLQGLAMSISVAALLALPFGLVELPGSLSPSMLGATLALALLVPLLPYAFEMTALRRLPTSTFGILMSMEPAMAVLAGRVVLGQVMSAAQLLGTALVVLASVGVTLRK
jgi:inner membrane transporter RhtA